MTSLLVAAGIGVVGVVPALAAGNSPAPAAFHHPDDDRDHDRWLSKRGDVRYVWFRVCDTDTVPAATTSGTTTDPLAPATGTVAPDAIAAAIEGANGETATDTTTVEPTPEATTADDDDDTEVYPTFVVVPLPKDEAKALRKMDDRPCFDLATGAPATTDPAATTTTDTTTDAATVTETPTVTPLDTGTTG